MKTKQKTIDLLYSIHHLRTHTDTLNPHPEKRSEYYQNIVQCTTQRRIIRNLRSGPSSIVYLLDDNTIAKIYTKKAPLSLFLTDVFWLEQLQDTGFVPKLKEAYSTPRILVMSNCGNPLSKTNQPVDWRAQLAKIQSSLSSRNCAHNDLKETDILSDGKKLYVVDFSFAQLINSGNQAFIRKDRLFTGRYIANLFELMLDPPDEPVELNTAVVWDPKFVEKTRAVLEPNFSIISEIWYRSDKFVRRPRRRIDFLNLFYLFQISQHGTKALTDFCVFIFIDQSPTYEAQFDGEKRRLLHINTKNIQIKNALREGQSGKVHISSNIQECFENLYALSSTLNSKTPIDYFDYVRPRFANLGEVFRRLNQHDVEYVVLFGLPDMGPDANLGRDHDVDFLVSDFPRFVRCLGAFSSRHYFSFANSNFGLPSEVGGTKFDKTILIKGEEVKIDVRVVGDGYLPREWQKSMLRNRVHRGDVPVPNDEDHVFSLLYHCLYHKASIPGRYIPILEDDRDIVFSNGFDFGDTDFSRRTWESALSRFMGKRGYRRELAVCRNFPVGAAERSVMSCFRDVRRELKTRMPYNAFSIISGYRRGASKSFEGRVERSFYTLLYFYALFYVALKRLKQRIR